MNLILPTGPGVSGGDSGADAWPGFLGRGWSFPPTFDRIAHAVDMAAADRDIRESLWILLSTRIGERIMLPTYGCDLQRMVFASLTTTLINEIAVLVTNAIRDWEPRVTVDGVSVTEPADAPGWVAISVDYRVRQTNSRSNLVYPFYRMEATLPLPPT